MPGRLITVSDAKAAIAEAIFPLASEQVHVSAAAGRILAAGVSAAGNVPPFACSSMDGYAIDAAEAGSQLEVIGEASAGTPSPMRLRAGAAIRISTGAVIPAGATGVVRQEDVNVDGTFIRSETDTPAGLNIRAAGEDMRAGDEVLAAGTKLGAAELGAAVAAGATVITVSRRPKVGILCTGDELRAPGEPLAPGQIHNSNAVMLATLAQQAGASVDEPRRLGDSRDQTEARLAQLLDEVDVCIVSGGVSVGPHDHVKPAFTALGMQERFWGVALAPGKPTWFGALDSTLVFGLPGNPVSAVVTFALFARAALLALQGARDARAIPETALLKDAVPSRRSREQALRVRFEDADGTTLVVPNGPQGSHLISSLLGAQALAMIPAGQGTLGAGARVQLEPLFEATATTQTGQNS